MTPCASVRKPGEKSEAELVPVPPSSTVPVPATVKEEVEVRPALLPVAPKRPRRTVVLSRVRVPMTLAATPSMVRSEARVTFQNETLDRLALVPEPWVNTMRPGPDAVIRAWAIVLWSGDLPRACEHLDVAGVHAAHEHGVRRVQRDPPDVGVTGYRDGVGRPGRVDDGVVVLAGRVVGLLSGRPLGPVAPCSGHGGEPVGGGFVGGAAGGGEGEGGESGGEVELAGGGARAVHRDRAPYCGMLRRRANPRWVGAGEFTTRAHARRAAARERAV